MARRSGNRNSGSVKVRTVFCGMKDGRPRFQARKEMRLMSEGSIPFSQTYKPSSSWRKFIPTSTQQPGPGYVMTVIVGERTTTVGPTVFKPALLPEDYEARIEAFFRFIDSLGSETETTDAVTAEK